MDTRWKTAATASNEFEATLLRDILVDSGIPAYIESSGTATFLQVGSALMPMRIMVPPERLAEAQTILAEVEIIPDSACDQPDEPADG